METSMLHAPSLDLPCTNGEAYKKKRNVEMGTSRLTGLVTQGNWSLEITRTICVCMCVHCSVYRMQLSPESCSGCDVLSTRSHNLRSLAQHFFKDQP